MLISERWWHNTVKRRLGGCRYWFAHGKRPHPGASRSWFGNVFVIPGV
jgi:hypothetical protein